MRSQQVADQSPRSRGDHQRLVGEAELHPEQNREIDGHPSQIAVQAHHQVFPHQGCFAHHLVERT